MTQVVSTITDDDAGTWKFGAWHFVGLPVSSFQFGFAQVWDNALTTSSYTGDVLSLAHGSAAWNVGTTTWPQTPPPYAVLEFEGFQRPVKRRDARMQKVDLVESAATKSTSSDAALLQASLALRIQALIEETAAPDDDTQDSLTDLLRDLTDKHGNLAIDAARLFLRQPTTTSPFVERVVRALGHVRHRAAIQGANWLLRQALHYPDVRVREAAVEALSLGAEPMVACALLREAAERESVVLLQSAMTQTAEQLEAWSRRHAAAAKDRAKQVG